MPASNLETLLDFETEIEASFVAYLATTLGLPATGSDTNVSLGTPRINVISTVVEQGPHQYNITTGVYAGRAFYDQFRSTVQIDLVYDPSFGQSQGTLRGKVRKMLTDYFGIKAAFAVNGYLLLAPDSLRQTGGTRGVNSDEKEETISTVIECVFFVNPDAIPQS